MPQASQDSGLIYVVTRKENPVRQSMHPVSTASDFNVNACPSKRHSAQVIGLALRGRLVKSTPKTFMAKAYQVLTKN